MCAPASAASCLPTGTEPVNDTLRTIGERIRCSDTSEGTPQTRLSTPGGRPASWNRRAMADDRARRVFRSLQDQRAARRQRRGDLADRLVDGKFQGVNAAHRRSARAPRVWHDGRARRDHAAVDTAASSAYQSQDVGTAANLAARLGERLALFERQMGGDGVSALTQQLRRLVQNRSTLPRRLAAPRRKAVRCRVERGIELGAFGHRQPADDMAGGGIEHVAAARSGSGRPRAVDEEAQPFPIQRSHVLSSVPCPARRPPPACHVKAREDHCQHGRGQRMTVPNFGCLNEWNYRVSPLRQQNVPRDRGVRFRNTALQPSSSHPAALAGMVRGDEGLD